MVINIQGEYFAIHRFPDLFKIKKLFSSTVIRVVKITLKPATGAFHQLIGSLRIDDFCTTTPLGDVIVPSRRLVEILIYDSQSDDDVGARAANFPAVSEVCLFGFFLIFFSQAGFSSNQNG